MIHYMIVVVGKDLHDAHAFAIGCEGLTGPILVHGGIETFTHLVSIYPLTFVNWLLVQQLDWQLRQIKE